MSVPTRRAVGLRQRLADSLATGKRCSVPGCAGAATDPPEATVGRFCRRHLEHARRHGSAWRGSFTAFELNAYRRAAWNWLEVNSEDLGVKIAVDAVRQLYAASGEPVAAHRLARLPATKRARAAWASLREVDADVRLALAAVLGVVLRIEDDRAKPVFNGTDAVPSSLEFRDVQVAKLILRMAGGSVRRWPRRTPTATPLILKSYGKSKGRTLRVLGDEAVEAARPILDQHGAALTAFAKSFVAKHEGKRIAPYPANVRVKTKARIPAGLKRPPTGATPLVTTPQDPHGGKPKVFVLGPDRLLTLRK